jgi:hypothetical protein
MIMGIRILFWGLNVVVTLEGFEYELKATLLEYFNKEANIFVTVLELEGS